MIVKDLDGLLHFGYGGPIVRGLEPGPGRTVAAVSDLAEFLLARIAEDEAAARIVDQDEVWLMTTRELAWTPARVLAECEAKRAVLNTRQSFIAAAQAATTLDMRLTAAGAVAAIDALLPYLALPYADHPDYRQEWRP